MTIAVPPEAPLTLSLPWMTRQRFCRRRFLKKSPDRVRAKQGVDRRNGTFQIACSWLPDHDLNGLAAGYSVTNLGSAFAKMTRRAGLPSTDRRLLMADPCRSRAMMEGSCRAHSCRPHSRVHGTQGPYGQNHLIVQTTTIQLFASGGRMRCLRRTAPAQSVRRSLASTSSRLYFW